MTADTSRAAVEALITEWHNSKGKSGYTGRGDRLADALAALLDERDAAEEKYRSWLADRNRQKERADDAEQRIRDLEATVDNLRLISNANGDWNIKYQEVNHRAERAEADRERFKFALESSEERRLTAEHEVARLTAQIAERDARDVAESEAGQTPWDYEQRIARLTAKLDSVKLYADDRAFHARGHLNTVNSGRIADDLRAILADTDEGNSK